MPPVLWNFDGNVLVVKIIGSHTTADISRAFTEAMSECPTGATLLVDIRSAFISISPDVLNERVRLISDSIGRCFRVVGISGQWMNRTPRTKLGHSSFGFRTLASRLGQYLRVRSPREPLAALAVSFVCGCS